MRKILFLMLVLAGSSAARAQSKAASWENLNSLQAGQQIQIRTMKSKKVIGAFVSVSDTAISVQADSGPETVQRPEVRSVKLRQSQHRLRNALIVGGAGAGVGAGIGAAGHHGCASTTEFCLDIGGRSLPAGIGAVIGLLGGAGVGALLPSHETVYSVTAH
jgi:hypothetical protein